MNQLEALLPGICDFLEHALSKENLSEQSEGRRKLFVEKLELLDIGYDQPPDTPAPAPNSFLKSLSLPNKQVSVDNQDYYEVPSHLQLRSPKKETQDEEKESNLTGSRELILPKRSQTQRFSGNAHLLEQPWTLVGPVYHRYKANKWQRLAFSLLAGARLLCYKWTRSLTPSLNIFLYGHTAIYAGRDSGMDHVIKLTHPSLGTYVLAADTEKQALQWTAQMNQYAQGLTPPAVISFMDDESKEQQQHSDDNVFTGGVTSSSSSEGGSSGDGIVGQHQSGKTTSQPRLSIAGSICSPQHHLIHQHNSSILSSGSNNSSPGHLPSSSSLANLTNQKNHLTDPLISIATSSIHNNATSTLLRSGGNLISTMKRKVESLGNRRKSRVFQFTPASDAIISGIAKIRLPSQSHWHERWCQLTPGLLEAFKTELSDCPQLDFALSLSQIVLDVSNDKKHPSAMRLSSTSCASEVLLFEVVEKEKVGEWIRAFFSALGIIPAEKRGGGGNQHLSNTDCYIDPIYDEVCHSHQGKSDGPPFRQRPSYIPPPSRQLLAQPLPTVPSISSKATSLQSVLTGRTRTSSRSTGNRTGNGSSDDTTSSDTLTVIGDGGGSCMTVGQPCASMMTSFMSYADSIVLTGNNSDEEGDITGTLERHKKRFVIPRRVTRRSSVSEVFNRRRCNSRYGKLHYGHLRTSLSCSNLNDFCNQTSNDCVTPIPHSNVSTLSRRSRKDSDKRTRMISRSFDNPDYNTDTIGSTQTAYSIDCPSLWGGNLASENFDIDEETDLDNEEYDPGQVLIEQACQSSSDRWCAAIEPYLDWADVTLDRKSRRCHHQQVDDSDSRDAESPSTNRDQSVVGCTLADLIARFECQPENNASCDLSDLQCYDQEDSLVPVQDSLLEERGSLTLPLVRDGRDVQYIRRCVSSDNGFSRLSSHTPGSTSTTSSSRCSVESTDSSSRMMNSIKKCTLRRTSVEIATEEMKALKLDVTRLRRKKSDLKRSTLDMSDCGLVDAIEAIEQEILLKSNRIEALQVETNKRHLYYVSASDDKACGSCLPASIESSAETTS